MRTPNTATIKMASTNASEASRTEKAMSRDAAKSGRRNDHKPSIILRKILLRIQGHRSDHPVLLEAYKAIYLPIPKVASSSIKQFFADCLGIESPTPHTARLPSAPRERLAIDYADYFKFCFMRNPWERVVSCYAHKIKRDWNINRPPYRKYVYRWLTARPRDGRVRLFRYPVFNSRMTFREFVQAVAEIPDTQADTHIRSQHTFISDQQGRLLVDYVGRFEHLGDEFASICKRLGIRKAELPHLLKMNHDDYRTYYDQETWGIVRERYARDLELLGLQLAHLPSESDIVTRPLV